MILSSTIHLYFLVVLTLSKHVYDGTLIAVHAMNECFCTATNMQLSHNLGKPQAMQLNFVHSKCG